jgi:hypothetical protein
MAKRTKRGPGRPSDPNGVGSTVKRLLLAGVSTDEVLVKIRGQFPWSKMRRRGVSFYRSMLRLAGHAIPVAARSEAS